MGTTRASRAPRIDSRVAPVPSAIVMLLRGSGHMCAVRSTAGLPWRREWSRPQDSCAVGVSVGDAPSGEPSPGRHGYVCSSVSAIHGLHSPGQGSPSGAPAVTAPARMNPASRDGSRTSGRPASPHFSPVREARARSSGKDKARESPGAQAYSTVRRAPGPSATPYFPLLRGRSRGSVRNAG